MPKRNDIKSIPTRIGGRGSVWSGGGSEVIDTSVFQIGAHPMDSEEQQKRFELVNMALDSGLQAQMHIEQFRGKDHDYINRDFWNKLSNKLGLEDSIKVDEFQDGLWKMHSAIYNKGAPSKIAQIPKDKFRLLYSYAYNLYGISTNPQMKAWSTRAQKSIRQVFEQIDVGPVMTENEVLASSARLVELSKEGFKYYPSEAHAQTR